MPNLFPITPSEQLLGRLVAGVIDPASIAEEQWVDLIALALHNNLEGMLLWSLRQAGFARDGSMGQSAINWQPLMDATRIHGRRSLLRERARFQAATALDSAGIPALWLKGIALAHTLYPEPHLRPMVDLDVLVLPDQKEKARAALLGSGFQVSGSHTTVGIGSSSLVEYVDQLNHHDCLIDSTGKVSLELHFRLLSPIYDHLPEGKLSDLFWAQTVDLAPSGPSFRILKPEANFLHLCAHAMLHHHNEPPTLLHLLDLHLLATHNPFVWGHLVEQAVALRWTWAVEQALRLVRACLDTPLPNWVLEALAERRPADEHISFAASPGQSVERWAEWSYVFGGMNTVQRLRLMRLTFFPPREFVRQKYDLHPDRLLFPFYFRHWLDGGREAARALLQRSS